jgi:hypothetical protein
VVRSNAGFNVNGSAGINAPKLAAKLQSIGLKKLPDFLIDYSVGDYSGMCNKIHSLAELFLDGDGPVLAEVTKAIALVVTAATPVVAAAVAI